MFNYQNVFTKIWLSEKSVSFLIFAGILSSILLRDPSVYLRAEFWAEDCTEFFKASHELGIKSLFTPIWGYNFFLGRSIAYVSTFFSIVWAPTIYSVSTLLILSYCIGYFCRDGFKWVIRNKFQRFLFCLLIVTGQGQEVFWALCNIYPPLTLFGFLLLLEKPWPPSRLKMFGIFLISISSGVMFAVIPLVVFMIYLTRKNEYYIILFIILGVSIYNLFGTTTSDSLVVKTGELKLSNIYFLPELLLKNFVTRLLIIPFLGQSSLQLLSKPYFFELSIILFALFFYQLFKLKILNEKKFYLIFIFYSSTIAILGVVALVRSSSIVVLNIGSGLFWGIRYFFLPSVSAIFFWGFIISKQLRGRVVLNSFILLVILFSTNLLNWKAGFVRPDLRWKEEVAPKLQKSLHESKSGNGINQSMSFPVHPNWTCTVSLISK